MNIFDYAISLDSPHPLFVLVIVAFIAMAIGLVCLVLFGKRPDTVQRFNSGKEVLIMFLGIVGMILGFYMGR